eukprot:TRINITY_DN616_c0_g2_i1.p1 TRINITY_DN616_c0_g2~~TRINITY_DN616_c0_g2_i1.p1  ORF type:complete len:335 (-),score=78.58 TRINITY_DN616_c0_g2_i1:86-1090(-)
MSWSWANPKSYYTSKAVTTAEGDITHVHSFSGDGTNAGKELGTNNGSNNNNNQNQEGYWASWGTYLFGGYSGKREDKGNEPGVEEEKKPPAPALSRGGGIKVESDQHVIEYILRWLNQHQRVKHLGVFRASGKRSSMNVLFNDYHMFHSLKLQSDDDVHTVCGLLSRIIREIQPPIIPLEEISEKNEEALNSLKTFYQTKMTKSTRLVLEQLIRFYKFISEFEEENKMTVKNLSIVVGPNLCRRINEDQIESEFQLLDDSRRGVFLAESLLTHIEEFFGQQELFIQPELPSPPLESCTVDDNPNPLLLMDSDKVYDDPVYKCDICKQFSKGGVF